jgi:hypothetical protein
MTKLFSKPLAEAATELQRRFIGQRHRRRFKQTLPRPGQKMKASQVFGKSDCLGVVLRGRQSHRGRADPESAEATDMARDARHRNRHQRFAPLPPKPATHF